MLKDLSLEAAEEMDVNREDITAELATEWMRRKERRWLRIDDVPMAMVVLCLRVGLCFAKRPMKERDLTSLKHLHRNKYLESWNFFGGRVSRQKRNFFGQIK
jgi:hypothetical protein